MSRPNTETAFWSYVERRGPDECWPWKASENGRGYGVFCINNKRRIASRAAYEFAVGSVPKGMFVCHRCDNPSCCNPAHLFIGTPSDNTQDMLRKGRGYWQQPGRERKPQKPRRHGCFGRPRQTHCNRGHELTPENTYIQVGARTRRCCRECKNANTRAWAERQRAAKAA